MSPMAKKETKPMHCSIKRVLAQSLVFTLLLPTVCLAAKVDIARVFRERKVVVATNYNPEKLADVFAEWALAMPFNKLNQPLEVKSTAEFLTQRDSLKGWIGDTLFVIDRSAPMSDEELKMLNPTVAKAKSGECITLVQKRNMGDHKLHDNGWVFEITAPNEKWLQKQLERFPRDIAAKVDENMPTVAYRYDVVSLAVVSTEGRAVVDRWIESQFDPKGYALDYVYHPLNDDLPEIGADENVCLIADMSKAGELNDKEKALLPEAARKWLLSDKSSCQMAGVKEFSENSSTWRAALFAPSGRWVDRLLHTFNSIDKIPETCRTDTFHDLRPYSEMVIWVRSDVSKSVTRDLANKVAEQLGKPSVGFTTTSYLDTDIIDKIPKGDAEFTRQNALAVKKKLGTKALVVVTPSAITAQTDYSPGAPVCLTPKYEPFSEEEPSRPAAPDPEEVIIFRGHKYRLVDGDRRNDPHYKADYNAYEEALRDFPNKLSRWERARNYDEERRSSHRMTWQVSVGATESVRLSCNVVIYDLAAVEDDLGKAVYQSSIQGSAQRSLIHKTEEKTVVGEGNRPESPEVPSPKNKVSDDSLYAEAAAGCAVVLERGLVEKCLLPIDGVSPAVLTVARKLEVDDPLPARPVDRTVKAAARGYHGCSSKPAGAALEVARSKCKADALVKIKGLIAGNSTASDEEILAGMTVEKKEGKAVEGWDKGTKTYCVAYEYKYNPNPTEPDQRTAEGQE